MSKKLIKDYKFFPGAVPPSTDLYPNAVSLLIANRDYIIAEASAYLKFQATNQIAPTGLPYTLALLNSNRSFVIEEANAWIKKQIQTNSPPFVGYSYTSTRETKCKRDIGYTYDAWVADIAGGGNAETIRIARMYYRGGTIQLLSPTQEAAVYNFIKSLIASYVLTKTSWVTLQSPVLAAQVTSGTAAEAGGITKMNTLVQLVSTLITNGLGSLPSISYNYNAAYLGYTYNDLKCQRDTGYVIDGYIYDLTYGGNALTYYVASRYYINGVVQVNRPAVEVDVQTFVKNLINSYILTRTYSPSYQWTVNQALLTSEGENNSVTTVTTLANLLINSINGSNGVVGTLVASNGINGQQLPNAVALLEANKRFIQEEALAFIQDNINNNISPFVGFAGYNTPSLKAKCRRDISYILEGYITDLKHGGNRQTNHNAQKYWENGLAQITIGNRQPEISTHGFIRDTINNYIFQNVTFPALQTQVPQVKIPASPAETASFTRLKELSNTVTEVIQYGLTYLPATVENRGYIKVQGFYKLKDFLLVSNADRNTIMYNFADPDISGEVSYSDQADNDFPSFQLTSDKITTLTFDIDTSHMMVTDNIQVFVENKEQIVHMNSSSSDAMERMKVGLPQSMLDADFEYGLQPTKWQTVSLMRNYPSIYEVPGTDIAVTNVITDASSGTSGVGASLMTVTTQSPHGLTISAPFTIKALANTVLGFSRAEGSFLVSTVPSPTTFTYYAKSKVGTTNGDILATTYTQLRKGGFYTGASVGSPTFSVASTGSSGTITTSLISATGSNSLGFTGSPPPLGSPISGLGITTGTQVTGITGPGGVVTSTQLSSNANAGDLSIVVASTTGIAVGLIFDRGDGKGIKVTNISGSTVYFSSPLTSSLIGNSASYPGLSQSATSGSGSGAVFTVTRTGNTYDASVTTTGGGYLIGDTITILGTSLDGATTTNDVTITVTSASDINFVTSFNQSTIIPGYYYTTTSGLLAQGGSGTGLVVDITTDVNDGTITSVSVSNPGKNYTPGDTVTIVNPLGEGAVARFNNGTLQGGDGYLTSNNVATTGGNGSNLTVDIVDTLGAVTSVVVNNPGFGYHVGDVVTIGGSHTVDATIVILDVSINGSVQIGSVNTGGDVLTFTVAGSPVLAPSRDFVSAVTISAPLTSDIAASTSISYSAISSIQVQFTSAHGFVPGDSITVDITSSGSNHLLAAGPYYVEQVPTPTTLIYTARSTGVIDTSSSIIGNVYGRPDSYYVHRPFDGGVMLGTGGPQHGGQAIRMSKKYIRYQSGKGVMYNTGALFAPSYDIRSLSAAGTAVGSFITLTTDDVDHGCQIGAQIVISGVITTGYNGIYTVVNIIDERTLQIQAQLTLGSTTATIGSPCLMAVRNWHGATVRSGTFDEQNGMFWQYDGIQLSVCRRSSTFQIAGTIGINANSNLVTGSNTRFTQQLAAGDRIVIRGMSHVITSISSDTSMTVTPDFRGYANITNVKVCKTIDTIVPQEQWDLDPCNGSGPSGYNIDINKMQMIGMQWTWYGAGFIDFMLRGADGNYVFANRIRNSNVNTEAYMRTGNMPVRYEVTNEGAKSKLSSGISSSQTVIPLVDSSFFPESGTVYIDNELISYTNNQNNTLGGCTRASALNNFVSGSQRTFTAGAAATHNAGAGVILVSNTVTPIISHWGSAFMIDGQFDNDRGYIFNYASTGVTASVDKTTAFLIRLAPSVSNAQIGDLGEKELLNRAQLLLQGITIVSDSVSGGGSIVVEGVLNPSNYPTNVTDITWGGLNTAASGGQPSFAQVASGGSVVWGGNATTSTAAIQGAFTTTITAKSFSASTSNLTAISFNTVTQTVPAASFAPATSSTYQKAFDTTRSDFLILQTTLNSLNTQTTVSVGDTLTVTGNGTTLTGVTITNNTGNFSCTSTANTMYVGETITISGTFGGTGSISGYTPGPKTYYIIATNGNTTFQLSATYGGTPITTTAGTPTGLTYSLSSFIFGGQTISTITQNYITLNGANYARIVMSAPPTLSSGASTSNGQYNVVVQITSSIAARYNSALSNTRTDFLVTQTQYAASTATVTDIASAVTYITGSQTISTITPSYAYIGGVVYARIVMSANASASSTVGAGNNVTVTATSAATSTYGSAFNTARTDFLITDAQYASSGILAGDSLSATTYLTSGQTIQNITQSYINIGGTNYTRIVLSGVPNASSTSGSGNDVTVTVTAAGSASSYNKTNYLYFTSSTWLASGAGIGTKVASDQTVFPAGTFVSGTSTRTFGATTVYRVTFTQSANTSIASGGTLKFQFGAAYALPGEQVFSFLSNPGSTDTLDLSQLKELTSTAIGGRGTFPNGPDVLAINIYKVSGTSTTANVILRWGEAQA